VGIWLSLLSSIAFGSPTELSGESCTASATRAAVHEGTVAFRLGDSAFAAQADGLVFCAVTHTPRNCLFAENGAILFHGPAKSGVVTHRASSSWSSMIELAEGQGRHHANVTVACTLSEGSCKPGARTRVTALRRTACDMDDVVLIRGDLSAFRHATTTARENEESMSGAEILRLVYGAGLDSGSPGK